MIESRVIECCVIDVGEAGGVRTVTMGEQRVVMSESSSEPEDLTSHVIELDGIGLDDIDRLPDSVFAHSLKRILADGNGSDRYAGFANTP